MTCDNCGRRIDGVTVRRTFTAYSDGVRCDLCADCDTKERR